MTHAFLDETIACTIHVYLRVLVRKFCFHKKLAGARRRIAELGRAIADENESPDAELGARPDRAHVEAQHVAAIGMQWPSRVVASGDEGAAEVQRRRVTSCDNSERGLLRILTISSIVLLSSDLWKARNFQKRFGGSTLWSFEVGSKM